MPRRLKGERAKTEISRLLASLKIARARVAELEASVAALASELGMAMPKPVKQSWPVQLTEMMAAPEESQGQPAELSPADNKGEGRWI